MNILLVGSGGREHALAWRLAYSDLCERLYCAPGNAGIADIAECVDIAQTDIPALVNFSKENAIDYVVVGPEDPLVAGLADALQEQGIKVFGPNKAAARLEGSKAFTKDLCKKYNIPTGAYEQFTDVDQAKTYIRTQTPPIVVKADGLAAGKGVIIAQSHEEAGQAAEDMLSGNAFGEAGHVVVIEEFLDGEEVSFFALCDGKTVLPLTSAQDHKRVGDGDMGPNTGGMGAYSPAHIVDQDLYHKILNEVIQPTADAMVSEGCPFQGVFFAGLMIVEGEPKLIEYNVRFGDPECQTLMARLIDDLLELLLATTEQRLEEFVGKLNWSSNTALCVVMATNGYPGAYPKETVIKNIEQVDQEEKIKIFHAGTIRRDDGTLLSNGGRVLGVVSTAGDIIEAQSYAYKAIEKIDWPDGFCRKDIGWRAAEAVKSRKNNAA